MNASSDSHGKPDDHICHETDVGHKAAGLFDDRAIVPRLIAARHALQDPVVTRLHRQLQLAADDIAGRHHLQEPGLEVLRVGRHEAQPLQASDLLHGADESGEAAVAVRVCVVVDVLAEEDHLFCPCLNCLAAFGDDSRQRDVSLSATHLRHDAESAGCGRSPG